MLQEKMCLGELSSFAALDAAGIASLQHYGLNVVSDLDFANERDVHYSQDDSNCVSPRRKNLFNAYRITSDASPRVQPLGLGDIHAAELGLPDAMVAGASIDPTEVEAFLDRVVLVIAHNASFDRRFAERLCEAFTYRPWACSWSEVAWAAEGFTDGTKLQNLALSMPLSD